MVKRLGLLLPALICLLVLTGAGEYTAGHGTGSPGPSEFIPQPWQGSDYVMVFVMDDGFTEQKELTAAADSMDFPMTFAPRADEGAIITAEDIATWSSRGIEISNTGLAEHLTYGILKYDETSGGYPDSLGSATIEEEINPAWIEDFTGVDYGVNTFVIDIGPWSYDAARVAHVYGLGARGVYYDNSSTGGGGRRINAPGSPRWDGWQRLIRNDVPSIPYGFGSFKPTHSSDPTLGVFGLASAVAPADSIAVRADRLLYNVSDAQGRGAIVLTIHADVTREELEDLVSYVRNRGDTWIASMGEMLANHRYNKVPVDPPGWAVYAKLDTVTAASGLFWGPPSPVLAAVDSFLFHNGTTAVTAASYPHDQVADSTSFGMISTSTPTTPAVGKTSLLLWDTATLPISGSEEMSFLAFDVDALDGKTIVQARIGFYDNFALDASNDTRNYFSVIGVTEPEIIDALIPADPHWGRTTLCYAFSDSATTTAWSLDWDDFTWPTDLGPYAYPFNAMGAGTNERIVTDYLIHVQEAGLARAAFAFTGNVEDTQKSARLGANNASTTNQRPYLIVVTSD